MWALAEDEIVESRVDGADCDGVGAHLLDSHSYVLDHEWIKHSISILETRIIVAAIYLAARMHDEYRDCKFVAVFLYSVLSRLDLTNPRESDWRRVYHLPIGIVGPFSIILLQERVCVSITFSLRYFGILDKCGKIPYTRYQHMAIE